MKRLLPLSAAVLLLAAGCSPAPKSPDEVVAREVALLNELADAMEAKDRPRVEAQQREAKELGTRKKAIEATDEGRQAALKYKADLDKATDRMLRAAHGYR